MVSDQIKKLRIDNKLTQAEFGKKLGVSRTSVNAWEMGVSVPSLPIFIELSKLFKVSVDYMLELDNDLKISIGHLNKRERQMILDMLKQFDKFHKTRDFVRKYESEMEKLSFDAELLTLFLEDDEKTEEENDELFN